MENWAIVISILSLLTSAFVYQRSRSIDLQNQVYGKKLDGYERMVGEFLKLLSLLRKKTDQFSKIDFSNLTLTNRIEINKLADQIDLEVDTIQMEIAKHSIYFPKGFTDKLFVQLDSLYENLALKNPQDILEVQEKFELYIQEQTQALDGLIEDMRKEMNLDEFNNKLLERNKRENFRFDV